MGSVTSVDLLALWKAHNVLPGSDLIKFEITVTFVRLEPIL